MANPIDDLFKKKLENQGGEFKEEYWEEANKVLNHHPSFRLRSNKRRGWYFFGAIGIAALLTIISVTLLNHSSKQNATPPVENGSQFVQSKKQNINLSLKNGVPGIQQQNKSASKSSLPQNQSSKQTEYSERDSLKKKNFQVIDNKQGRGNLTEDDRRNYTKDSAKAFVTNSVTESKAHSDSLIRIKMKNQQILSYDNAQKITNDKSALTLSNGVNSHVDSGRTTEKPAMSLINNSVLVPGNEQIVVSGLNGANAQKNQPDSGYANENPASLTFNPMTAIPTNSYIIFLNQSFAPGFILQKNNLIGGLGNSTRNIQKNKSEVELSRLVISVEGGPAYIQRLPNSSNAFSYEAGALIQYNFHNRFSAGTGISLMPIAQKVSQKTDSLGFSSHVVIQIKFDTTLKIDSFRIDSFTIHYDTTTVVKADSIKTTVNDTSHILVVHAVRSTGHYVEIPAYLGFRFHLFGLDWQANTGIGYLIYSGGSLYGLSNKGELINFKPGNGFDLQERLNLLYSVDTHWKIMGTLCFRYIFLNKTVLTPTQKFLSYSLGAGIGYSF